MNPPAHATIEGDYYAATLTIPASHPLHDDFDPLEDGAVVRRYTRRGGYVHEATGQVHRQACNQLNSTGPTLVVSDKEDVVTVIRREWGRRQRAAKREREREGLER